MQTRSDRKDLCNGEDDMWVVDWHDGSGNQHLSLHEEERGHTWRFEVDEDAELSGHEKPPTDEPPSKRRAIGMKVLRVPRPGASRWAREMAPLPDLAGLWVAYQGTNPNGPVPKPRNTYGHALYTC